MGYVRTEPYGRESFYELREPLMRFCLKAKKQRGEPIELIVDFLRRWYTKTELQERLGLVGGEVSQEQAFEIGQLSEATLEQEYLLRAIQAFDDDDKDPRVVACWKEYLDCFYKEDYVLALQQAEKLVAIRGHAEDWIIQGVCLYVLKRYEQALASYDKALEFKSGYHYVWSFRGYTLDDLGRLEEAVASFDQALKFQPDLHDAWYNRGIALGKLGRLEEAVASFDQALKFQPDLHDAWSSRGYALDELGQLEEAVASFDQALKFQPDLHDAWNNRGSALDNLGRLEEAIASYDKALEIKPDLHEAWNNRGYALIYLGRYEEALASCEKAIELDDQSSHAFFNQAIVLLALNRWDEGITTLNNALNRLTDGKEPSADDTELIIRNLFNSTQDAANWKTRLTSLITLYEKYDAISALGQGLVRSLPMLMSEMVSDKAAQKWLEVLQELGSNYTEFQIPLRLLDAAVRYREKGDKRVLLELPIEERELLKPLLERSKTHPPQSPLSKGGSKKN
jgi:tetratricopeptide (TPR) repeat protein